MYKLIYVKPKYKLGTYKKYIDDITKKMNLELIKTDKKVRYLKNKEMFVIIEPKIAEILMYDVESNEAVKKVRKQFV